MKAVHEAIATLGKSERGQAAMRDLLAMLDNGGISLDVFGKEAIVTLLLAAFGEFTGSARDAMRDAVEIEA